MTPHEVWYVLEHHPTNTSAIDAPRGWVELVRTTPSGEDHTVVAAHILCVADHGAVCAPAFTASFLTRMRELESWPKLLASLLFSVLGGVTIPIVIRVRRRKLVYASAGAPYPSNVLPHAPRRRTGTDG